MVPLLGGGFLRACGKRQVPPQRRSAAHAAGFSLMEALIVVALVGIMAVMAVPWFLKISQRSQLRADAYNIQATLLGARMTAVKRNAPATITIIPSPGADTEHEIDTTYGATTDKAYIAAKRITFGPMVPANGIITFRGDGTLQTPPFPTTAQIVVTGPVGSGSPNTVRIEAESSGRIRVITPANWN
jgi:Tfp pilus assembly protein FimT